jgi:hypothetical protein
MMLGEQVRKTFKSARPKHMWFVVLHGNMDKMVLSCRNTFVHMYHDGPLSNVGLWRGFMDSESARLVAIDRARHLQKETGRVYNVTVELYSR